jgi:hypothetical protein
VRNQMKSPNNTINTDGKHARAFGAHMFAVGYGERWAGQQ